MDVVGAEKPAVYAHLDAVSLLLGVTEYDIDPDPRAQSETSRMFIGFYRMATK
jgi:hypothetical protein